MSVDKQYKLNEIHITKYTYRWFSTEEGAENATSTEETVGPDVSWKGAKIGDTSTDDSNNTNDESTKTESAERENWDRDDHANYTSDKDMTIGWKNGLTTTDIHGRLIKSKRFYIFHNFLKDFTESGAANYSEVLYLISSKTAYKAWLLDLNKAWKLLAETPGWLVTDDVLRGRWEAGFMTALDKVRGFEAACKLTQEKAKKLYDQSLAAAETKVNAEKGLLFRENPILLIHQMSGDSLSDKDTLLVKRTDGKRNARDKRKELLAKYKVHLLERYTKGDLSYEALEEIVK